MRFFEQIAWKAHASGKRARDYGTAAYGHAKAFWLFDVPLTAVVWWFAGWRWALIPGALVVWAVFAGISAGVVQLHMERLEKQLGGP